MAARPVEAPTIAVATRRHTGGSPVVRTLGGVLGGGAVWVVGTGVFGGKVVTPLPEFATGWPWGSVAMSTTSDHSAVHTSVLNEASPVVAAQVSMANVIVTGAPSLPLDQLD